MKQSHWLLCVAKAFDWSKKITSLPNLTRASIQLAVKLAVSCSELYFACCCALERTGKYASKSKVTCLLTDFKSDIFLFHSWHQSVRKQLFWDWEKFNFCSLQAAMLSWAKFICLRVAYREAFWEKLSRLIWGGAFDTAATAVFSTCSIFPQLTVTSWWQFSR